MTPKKSKTRLDMMSRNQLRQEITKARAEIKRQKRLIELYAEHAKEMDEDIQRRNEATKHFRHLEPRALMFALQHFDQWEAEGCPDMDTKSQTAEEAREASQGAGEFWGNVYTCRAYDYLVTMKAAKGHDLSEYEAKTLQRIMESGY